jgi:hypothetical protein
MKFICLVVVWYIFVIERSDSKFEFNYKKDYLDVNVEELIPLPTAAPSLWERLIGKKTKFGIVYAEIKNEDVSTKIPLFSYSAKSDNTYDVNTVSVGNGVVFPIVKGIPYNPNNAPVIKIYVKYWEDKKNAELINSLISVAGLFSSIDPSSTSKTLDISTSIISLVEKLFPSDDEKSSITIPLIEENIDRKYVIFGFDKDPVIKIGFRKRKGFFVGESFNSALENFKPEQYEAWKGAIIQLDQNIDKTGLDALVERLYAYSTYISTLPLNYADKVLLQANSIQTWANNAVTGAKYDENGNVIHLSQATYRRLDNSDWPLLDELTDNVLTDLNGSGNCATPQCKSMADYLSKSAVELNVNKYLPPKISISIDGIIEKVSKDDFVNLVIIKNDPGWDAFSNVIGTSNRWEARFKEGKIGITIRDVDYAGAKVCFVMVKIVDEGRENFFIQSLEVTSNLLSASL